MTSQEAYRRREIWNRVEGDTNIKAHKFIPAHRGPAGERVTEYDGGERHRALEDNILSIERKKA